MPLHLWFTFAAATFFISGTPGPNMLHMMSSGIRHGLKPALFTMAGCMLAVLLITSASAAGLGAVLAESPHLFDVLRVCGAAYLIYLGARAAFSPAQPLTDPDTTADILPNVSPAGHFRSGFIVGLSNPKLLLFAAAFFPQFIDKSLAELPQFLILLATFVCIEFGWYLVYAGGGSRIAKYLQSVRMQKIMNRSIGALFAGFGILLLKYKPA